MSILKVARMGHPVLRAKAKALSPGDIKHAVVQQLIDGMLESPKPDGDQDSDLEPTVLVNPEITPVGGDIVDDWEGCLSIPDIRGRVPRSREIRLRGFNREGGRVDMTLAGFAARVA